MKKFYSVERLALPEVIHYEEVVKRIDIALVNRGYEKSSRGNKCVAKVQPPSQESDDGKRATYNNHVQCDLSSP